MKKNARIKTQSILAALALSLVALNAIEQDATQAERLSSHQEAVGTSIRLTMQEVVNKLTGGMNPYDKRDIIKALEKVNPDRYTELFINIVNKLSQGMNAFYKSHVIGAVGKVNPDDYKDFINTVNELSQGMDADDKSDVIEAVGKVNPDDYKDFIKIVKRLSQGMNADDKRYVIMALGCVNPDRYKEPFIKTVNALSQEMNINKCSVIGALGKVNPGLYTDFTNTAKALLQGVDRRYNKSNVIGALGRVNPNHYTDFINTVNVISEGMDESDKTDVIQAVGRMNSDLFPFLQNFIRQNPQYFTYVPADQFLRSIALNMTQQERQDMTQQQLQELLESLHRQYYRQAPAGTPQALAFEIHNFANQEVVGETGQKQRFNQAVLNHIESSIEGDALDYNIVLGLLSSELATLQSDPLKSDAIDEKVYNWVIESNEEPQAQKAITTVVTYLEQKDNTHGKLATWLYVFMDESKNAYDGRNRESCIKGVKERVITSLRSAIPEGDSVLENLFYQAEATFMMAAKSKKVTDHAFWVKKLKQKGVTSSTPEPQAKIKFKEALVDFFAADKGAQATIDAALDFFEDSPNLSNDGLWSKIKDELLKIEQDAARQARAE